MKILIQVVAFALVACPAAQAQQAVKWRTEDGGNGHWYAQINYGGGRTYSEAKLLCESRGGHLATIASSGEQAVVCDVMTALTGWIGAERTEQGWGWCTGEPWTFGSICSPTPNADRIQLYGCMCWNDTFDHDTLTAVAIIEWSADCNTDGIVDYGQILQGQLPDTNTNGIPDGCECSTSPTLPACCTGDLNQDAVVNGADLGILLNAWGACSGTCHADFNRDGSIDGSDLGVLLGRWGTCS